MIAQTSSNYANAFLKAYLSSDCQGKCILPVHIAQIHWWLIKTETKGDPKKQKTIRGMATNGQYTQF